MSYKGISCVRKFLPRAVIEAETELLDKKWSEKKGDIEGW